ncbi:MAG TPA: SGNH/GDSL hydrolase family protein [Chitinivibrionales bacterium]|nr:SGNH/GDSL hydrolase family protein [Chitinivibrionales bacterium]
MAIAPVKGMTILFTGDSITDCGRRADPSRPLGSGYAFMVSSRLSALYPELDLRFVNRGVSGDRVADLAARWQWDCLKLKPTLVSVLAGVNDTWRRLDSGDPTSGGAFSASYRRILELTKRETQAAIVLCEPFLLACGQVDEGWFDDLEPKIEIVRSLAREFSCILVPLVDAFEKASKRAAPQYWAEDGVHPTAAGHALIAQAWLKHVFDIG